MYAKLSKMIPTKLMRRIARGRKHLQTVTWRPYLITSIAALALFSLVVVGSGKSANLAAFSGKEYTVLVTDDSFSPAEISIGLGDKITFVNKTKTYVWPASDPHPTHEYLAGFDPMKPIQPSGTWSFVFKLPGTWRYHDHLRVSLHGTVIVKDSPNLTASTSAGYSGKCTGQCFDDLIAKTVKEKGIDAAYKVFTDIIDRGEELPRNCHWTAHRIGEAAFALYDSGKKFTITNSTSFCGFGFYHGFLEKLLRKYPDNTASVLKFCDEVTAQLGKMGYYNCVHGIGHGFTEDPPDPKTFGDANAMLKPGIGMCEKLFGESYSNLSLCLSGVYTVIVKFADHEQYGLKWDEAAPFGFCKTQPRRYQKACFGEYAPKMDYRLKWDWTKFRDLVNSFTDDKIRRQLTWVISSVYTGKDILKDYNDKYIESCRENFQGNLLKICWGGIILGYFSNAEPEKQYLKAFGLCESRKFSDEERDFCYGETIREARMNYSKSKAEEVCRNAPSKYQKYCSGDLIASPYDDPNYEQN